MWARFDPSAEGAIGVPSTLGLLPAATSILFVAKSRLPSTPALRLLRRAGVAFEVLTYDYVARGGARASSEALGIPLHQVCKTLVFEDESRSPLVVVMHGDLEVSARSLARAMKCKSVRPCAPDVAERHSGYRVGGTSPFGTRRAMPTFVEKTVLDLDAMVVNAGARGVLVRIAPAVLSKLKEVTPVSVARPREG